MPNEPEKNDSLKLSPDEARAVVKAIEEVEKEEAATEEQLRDANKGKATPSA